MVVDKYGKENTILLFADTNMEDEDLYRFLAESIKVLGCRYVRIADGRTPWQVFEDEKFIGNTRVDPCSKILKRQLLVRWITGNFKPEECRVYVGIDYSESHRLPPIVERMKPYHYSAPMVEEGIMLSPAQKAEACRSLGIEPPRLYELGFPHNNCGGMCVKAGLGQFKLLFEKLPERYAYHEQQQEEIMSRNPKLKPFLRKKENGVMRYITLKQYREQYLEKDKAECDALDFGGCGCALE